MSSTVPTERAPGDRAPAHRTPAERARGSAHLASSARQRVLVVLGELGAADAPVDASAVAEAVGVHVSTARFHLDRLVEAGAVAVATEPTGTGRRGRPRLRYGLSDPAARAERAKDGLIVALASALASRSDGRGDADDVAVLARAAGRRWAASPNAAPDASTEHPTERLERMLAALGFGPERDEAGFDLAACPFREAARTHGVICEVHRGLIEQVVGDDAPCAVLLPFTAPDRCRVVLGAAR